jgi:cytosolic carboxypeptidase protein 5
LVEDNLLNRPLKIDKPVILLTARVHPGESPASYCMEGALRFLLDENDFRSYILRKNFLILAVPMLNPDGVFNGMFRSDMLG